MEEILNLLSSVNPDDIKDLADKVKPLIYVVSGEIFGLIKDLANNKEVYKTFAKADKNQYDALVNVGFSKEQALAIMLNDTKQIKNLLSNGHVTLTKDSD